MSPVGLEIDQCRDQFQPSGELSYMSTYMHECRSNERYFFLDHKGVGLREFLNRYTRYPLLVDAAPALPRRVSSTYRSALSLSLDLDRALSVNLRHWYL